MRQADDSGLFPAPQFGQVIISFLGTDLIGFCSGIPAAHYTQSLFYLETEKRQVESQNGSTAARKQTRPDLCSPRNREVSDRSQPDRS
jgi:hypothetical protein